MVKRKATCAVIVGLLALATTLQAEMMPVPPSEIGTWMLPGGSGSTEPPPTRSRNPFVFPGIMDGDLPPMKSLLPIDSEIRRVSQAQRGRTLSDDRSSFDLCLCALISLGVCRSAPFVRKMSFGPIPNGYHNGGPFQIGHSHALGPDLRFAPLCGVVQPDGMIPDRLPRSDRRTTAPWGRESQRTPALPAPRGPPLSS